MAQPSKPPTKTEEKRASVMMSSTLHRRLRIAAALAGCRIQDIVLPALEAELKRRGA